MSLTGHGNSFVASAPQPLLGGIPSWRLSPLAPFSLRGGIISRLPTPKVTLGQLDLTSGSISPGLGLLSWQVDDEDEGIDLPEAAYRRHRGEIFRYLLRQIGDPDDAEELTQAVFAEAAAALPRLAAPPDSLLAWLYTVAQRRFVDEVRRRSRRRGRAHLLYTTEAVEPTPYGIAVGQAVREAIETLPPEQRGVVVMRLFEDRPFAEIASRTGATEAACKMRFARGLALVRDQLYGKGIEP
ncbi:MAG TPA: RNA polymerase sigma factor [Gaiellaceae bacterium]